jgi:hypothetical protein
MSQPFYIFILALGLLSCSGKAKDERGSSSTDSLQVQSDVTDQNGEANPTEAIQLDPSKIECMTTAYRYGDDWTNFSPGTFEEITYVYNSANSVAKIIDTLKFNTSVNILAEYPEFYLVCHPTAKSGYIKKTDLYFHPLTWSGKSYLFGISNYGTSNDTNCNNSQLKVVTVNIHSEKDIYYDSILGKDYKIEQIYNSALKNAEALFYLHYHCYSEIGVAAEHFIVDNGKLSRLIIALSSGDGGYSDISSVYLPIHLTNGEKIVLAKNGVLSVDETTAKVETYPYPANCGIPIDELIIVENKTVGPVLDEKGETVEYNKDGTQAEKITIEETIYYQWDGKALRKVKTIRDK